MSDFSDFGKIEGLDEFSEIFDSVFGEENSPESGAAPEEVRDVPEAEYGGEEDPFAAEAETSGAGEEEFDPRFNLDRNPDGTPRRRGYSYAGHRVSTTQEYGYTKKESPEYEELRSSYAGNEDYEFDREFGFTEEEKKPDAKEKVRKFVGGKRREEAYRSPVAGPDDGEEPDGAEPDERDTGRRKSKKEKPKKKWKELKKKDDEFGLGEDYEGEYENEDDYIPVLTFKEYISSRIAAIALKLRGSAPAGSTPGSAYAEPEYLGEELDPLSASKYYGSHVHSLRLRTRLAFILTALSVYISVGGPAPGMLASMKVASCMSLAILFTVMILSLDIVTNAFTGILRGRFGADALALLSCIVSAIDALMVINSVGVTVHMPLCALSSLTMCGMLLSSLMSARAMRKALRVPAIGKKKYTVTTESNVTGKEITTLKSSRPVTGFVRRLEEAPIDETMFGKISVYIAAFAFLLALVAALIRKSPSRILYIYAVILSACVPFTALLGFAFPFLMGSVKIFGNGAALAGWSGVCDLGHSRNIIVTDRDLFPEDSIEIENVRIFADYDADKVITYTGSLITLSGCGLAPVFNALMEENGCTLVPVDNLEYLAGGGIKGMAEGHVIIAGGTDLMRLMNIRVPYRLVSNSSVLLSIDGILYGIFNINYKADPHVRKALVSLMRSSRHPVFAIRDFNITPEMIREKFDVATDGYDFPPYVDRFRISEAKPSADSQISGIVCREGLGPLTDLADTARKIFSVSRISVIISMAAALAGCIYPFITILSAGTISVGTLFIFRLIFSVPVLLLGLMVNTLE